MAPRVRRDGDESVVPFGLAVLGLLGLDDPDEVRGHEAADEGRLIHQYEDVERVAVLTRGRGHEPEVEREDSPRREDAAEHEEAPLLVVFELIAVALGRLDDDIRRVGFGVESSQRGVSVVCHASPRRTVLWMAAILKASGVPTDIRALASPCP